MVECLTRDPGITGSSLIRGTVSLSKTLYGLLGPKIKNCMFQALIFKALLGDFPVRPYCFPIFPM